MAENEKVLSDNDLRRLWREAGGGFHGPRVETGTMPEAKLLPFLRGLALSLPDGEAIAGTGGVRESGPTKIVTEKLVCDGCPALCLKDWEFEGENDDMDSGTDATCGAAGKPITGYWHKGNPTPEWCPARSALASNAVPSGEHE